MCGFMFLGQLLYLGSFRGKSPLLSCRLTYELRTRLPEADRLILYSLMAFILRTTYQPTFSQTPALSTLPLLEVSTSPWQCLPLL